MMIQTLGRKYNVIRYVYSDSNTERYICMEEEEGTNYTVIRIKNRMWIMRTMEFLMRQMENHAFTDFVSCFASGEYMHVVMKYAEGIPLKGKLQDENCPLEERMAIGKAILDKIMLLNMPDYFLQDCLKQESIIVSPALEINFRYCLSDINQYGRVQFRDVQICLRRLFEALFGWEMDRRVLAPASRFCSLLKRGEYQDILAVYADYGAICREIGDIPAVELATPRTRGFLAWERIKRCFAPVKKILFLLVMLCAVFFLVYSVYESMQEGGRKELFEYIGTLEIKD